MTDGLGAQYSGHFDKMTLPIFEILLEKGMKDLPRRIYLKHEIPSLVIIENEYPAFFITICCQQRGIN
jgi:hypothetical protein